MYETAKDTLESFGWDEGMRPIKVPWKFADICHENDESEGDDD